MNDEIPTPENTDPDIAGLLAVDAYVNWRNKRAAVDAALGSQPVNTSSLKGEQAKLLEEDGTIIQTDPRRVLGGTSLSDYLGPK